jgi:hypothetical protein
MGAKVKVQKQKFEGAVCRNQILLVSFISQGEVAAQKKWCRPT